MEDSDQNFFEALAKEKINTDANFEIELAKADTGVSVAPHIIAAKPIPKSDDEAEPEGQLTIDVYQTPTDIIVESAIAGVKPENIDINVATDSVTVRGERRREKEVRNEDYFYQECYWGKFSRSVILPQEVDPEGATVNFKNGILTIHLPKINRQKTKRLKVKTD